MDLLTGVHDTSYVLYNLFLIPVTFFSFIYYLTAMRGILSKEGEREGLAEARIDWPKVTIQIPTYNEPVAIRCAKACLEFDYPKDRYEIIIGDDSTDPLVSKALDGFAQENHGMVKVTRRGSNGGFKPGNLNHMLRHSSGDVIVVFDSDFTAKKDFLKRIVAPMMEDEEVGAVQAEWEFMNERTNLVSKLSATLLMFYYSLIVPLNKNFKVPLLFGSGEAVRRKVLEELGGWTEGSLTEDTDFSLRMLSRGYKLIYLEDLKAAGEVPYTLKGLLSQQRRWAYGNTRAYIDNSRDILFGRYNIFQKTMLTYTTYVGYVSNFVFLLFLFSGGIYFFSQPLESINLIRFFNETGRILLVTSGFIAGGVVALLKKQKIDILLPSLLSVFTIGVIASAGVCIGFSKAVLGRELCWSAITKEGNQAYGCQENV